MLLRREGLPEEGEFVLCTVTSVQHNSVFTNLDEYGKTGLIHISEISPGRIRNIRDYVVEGKKIVCLILRISAERGHIDLSLRRVNESQRRNKINEIKQEQKAEKIVEYVAKKLDIGLTLFYKEVFGKVIKKYNLLHEFFENVGLDKSKIEELGLDKEKSDALEKAIKDRIKPTEVSITFKLELTSYASNGLDIVKGIFEKIAAPNVSIKYEGGGTYRVVIKADDYKAAESIKDSLQGTVTTIAEKQYAEAVFPE